MKKYILFLLLLPFTSLNATTIAVIDIEEIINKNKQYISALSNIEINQEPYLSKFNEKEIYLDDLLVEIEESKVLLSNEELNNKISTYNQELNAFTKIIDNFNIHYENQIINIRKIILDEIIILIEKYAKNNNIDLVLDSTSYLIASNSINITNFINDELKNIDLELDFTNFEEN